MTRGRWPFDRPAVGAESELAHLDGESATGFGALHSDESSPHIACRLPCSLLPCSAANRHVGRNANAQGLASRASRNVLADQNVSIAAAVRN